MEEHVNKANRTLCLIRNRRSYQFQNRRSMKLLFTALVRPHLEFRYICCLGTMLPERQTVVLIEGVLRWATKSEKLKCMNLPSVKRLKYRQERADMIET